MTDQRNLNTGLLVWIICALFFSYEFLLRTVVGTFQQPIMTELALTPFGFALLSSSAYLIIYGMMQVPVGILSDYFGLKKTLVFAAMVCAVSCLLFSVSTQFKSAIIIRMLMGLGSSFGFVCLLIAVYDWLPRKYFGLFIGLSQFIGTIGPMIAAGPLQSLSIAQNLDWRINFVFFGIIGLVLSFLIYLYVKNNTSSINEFTLVSPKTPIGPNLKKIFTQKQIWLISIYTALVYFTLEYLSENEGTTYLELCGLNATQASYMVTLGWLGYALGCPILGYISDKLQRRKIIMSYAALILLLSMVVIVFLPTNLFMLSVAFIFLGFGTGGQSLGFAIMAEQCEKNYVALGLGFNNAILFFVSSINAPAFSYLLHRQQQSTFVTLPEYQFSFSFIIVLIFVAFTISLFSIQETHCCPTKELTTFP